MTNTETRGPPISAGSSTRARRGSPNSASITTRPGSGPALGPAKPDPGDPATGRFLQTDPIGRAGGLNLYAYAGGDPVNATDPWGLSPYPDGIPTIPSVKELGAWAPFCRTNIGAKNPCHRSMAGGMSASFDGIAANAFASITDDIDRNGGSGGYDPNAWNFHDYTVTNLICPAVFACGPAEIEDMALRFAIPGADGSWRAIDGQRYDAFDPIWGIDAGPIRFFNLGWHSGEFSTRNRTLPGHLLHEGQITRTFFNVSGVGWYVRTHGVGQNNFFFGGLGLSAPVGNTISAAINQRWGVGVFLAVDSQIYARIRARRP
jgi:hypothetical protein